MSSETRTGPSSSLPPSPSEIGQSAARYLFAIARLAERSDERIRTGDLRESLDVTPASVTEMISKLDDRGLVDYEKYQGVTLTDRGDTLATQVAWRFCIVSTFFESELDTDLEEQTAFAIAFTLPRDGMFSLRERVTAPCHGLCPESSRGFNDCVV